MTEEKKDFWKAVEDLQEVFKAIDEDYDRMAANCESELKLAVTRWAMKHIVEHARDGGSYRVLIYNKLGFGPEAYGPLLSDGMVISNEFDLSLKEEVAEFLKNGDIEGAKKRLGYCDEPGCFKSISCGYPTDDGYRMSCGDHYHEYKKSVGEK
jgi:hypothetical protein